MSAYYLDTSALVKLYIPEAGSDRIDSLANAVDADGRPLHLVAFSRLAVAEVASALARRARLGELPEDLGGRLFARFLRDCADRFLLLAVLDPQVRRAASLAHRFALRAYDAVHLAAALDLADTLAEVGMEAPIFLSADRALCEAATVVGVTALDPASDVAAADRG